jgi:hypothetical protein
MNTKYDAHDWSLLCATTDTLFAEFGSRRLAFAEACRRNPYLNATPPSTVQALAPQEASGPEDSAVVKACEALAAAPTKAPGASGAAAPDATPADPLMRAVDHLVGRAGQ